MKDAPPDAGSGGKNSLEERAIAAREKFAESAAAAALAFKLLCEAGTRLIVLLEAAAGEEKTRKDKGR